MSFAELLVHHRTASGLSQEQLAAMTTLSVRAIGDLERGATRRPQRASVMALADGLGLTGATRDTFTRASRLTPPPQTRRPAKGALPVPTASVIGRDADIDAVAGLLSQPMTRLVTVTGPGGVGKSAVALQVARQVADRFDAAAVLDLSRVDPHEVGPAVAAQLEPGSARTLLLLDGFQHGDAAALALAGLLARHRRLRILLTAPGAVKLRGEHVWPLPPLPGAAAVALLTERARQVRAGFRPEPGVVEALCRRLAGLPRAIELAALRLRAQDPADLDADLAQELPDHAPHAAQEVVGRMVAAAVARLPAVEVERLAVVAACPPGISPAALRDRLAAAGRPTRYLDVTIAALAATGLITVDDRDGEVHLRALPEVTATGNCWQKPRQDSVGYSCRA